MVTSPNEGMITSVGARAGLTGVLKALSFAAAADGVTINQLLPERFATQRQVDNANRRVEREGITFEEAWAAQAATIAAKRHGEPAEFGAMCAFICSAHAGFVSGHEHPPRRWELQGDRLMHTTYEAPQTIVRMMFLSQSFLYSLTRRAATGV